MGAVIFGGDTHDIAEPTYKGFNQVLDKNPTAYKGFNQLEGFQPTTEASTNLLDNNPSAYKTKILHIWGGDTHDIAEPIYKGITQLQDKNPTYKTKVRPHTRQKAYLLDKQTTY